MNTITLYIEAVIFASEQSITKDDIRQVIENSLNEPIGQSVISLALEEIKQKYGDERFAISLTEINGGYQFLTKKKFYEVINQLQIQRSKKKLTQAAMETLAIIAYKQPITKLEIEHIRGVNCDYSVQKLLEKELISFAGKAETVGKPILYKTSDTFMDYFGINSAAELPQLKDILETHNEIGSGEL